MVDSGPLVTVITVCLNAERTIEKTIQSVLGQSYRNIEYRIVDGGSTDDTLNIIRKYSDSIACVVSEKDEGISDAFNKGLALAKGEFVQFLNADDVLDKSTIERSVRVLTNHPDVGFVFGDIVREDENKKALQRLAGNARYAASIRYVMKGMNHPTILARRRLYEEHGGYSKRWKYAMDYDWIARVHRAGERGIYDRDVVVRMKGGGLSDRHAVEAYREVMDISIIHGFNAILARAYFFLRVIKHHLMKFAGLR